MSIEQGMNALRREAIECTIVNSDWYKEQIIKAKYDVLTSLAYRVRTYVYENCKDEHISINTFNKLLLEEKRKVVGDLSDELQ